MVILIERANGARVENYVQREGIEEKEIIIITGPRSGVPGFVL